MLKLLLKTLTLFSVLLITSLTLHAESNGKMTKFSQTTTPLKVYINKPNSNHLRLANGTDQATAIIPVSNRTSIDSIKIHIQYINSISLSKDRSQLRFRFNGTVIGQVPLDPSFPEGSINLTIPKSAITLGDNILQFESSLHTSQADASLYSSELWTEINLDESTISITSHTKPIQTKLSEIPSLVYGIKHNNHFPIAVLTPGSFPTDTLMNAASYVVQKFAHLTNNVPVSVYAANIIPSTSTSLKTEIAAFHTSHPNMDSIILGTYSDLSKTIGSDLFKDVGNKSQMIAMHRDPINPSLFVLVLAGKTEADVLKVSQYFSEVKLSLINQSYILLDNSTGKVVEKSSNHPSSVESNMRYTFSQLGLKTTVLTGINDAAEVQIKLPAGLFAITDEDVDVMLHIAYSAFLGEGSAVSVLLNGEFIHSIPLNVSGGLHVNSWRLAFPLRAFKRGLNTIRFQGHIVPSTATKEHQHMVDSIKVTLFEDSVVRIPNMSQYTRLPDLELLQTTAFPYAESGESLLYVPKKDINYVSTALSLISKLSQVQGEINYSTWLSSTLEGNKNKNMLIVTSPNSIPQDVLNASPLKIIEHEIWAPMSDAYEFSGVPKNVLTSLLAYDLVIESFTRMANPPVLQLVDMERQSVLTQFESPFAEEKSITLFIAKDPKQLKSSMDTLIEPKNWSTIKKDSFIWGEKENGEIQTSMFKISDEYHTGEMSFLGKVAYYAITSPIYLLLLIISLVVLLTWLTRQLLLRHSAFHSHH